MSHSPYFKVEYLYGIASSVDPEGGDLYERIRAYIHEKKLDLTIDIEDFVDHRILEKFYRQIETQSGFEELDFEGAWDPDTKKAAFILVLARYRAPEDKEEVDKIKRAVAAINTALEIEGKEKWYVDDNDEIGVVNFSETAVFDLRGSQIEEYMH